MFCAREDISHVDEFDYIIINHNLDIAAEQLKSLIVATGLCRDQQLARNTDLIDKLRKKKIISGAGLKWITTFREE